MSIFEKELISGRVSYDSLPDADASDFTYPFLESPGVVFQYRKYLLYKDVFYGEGGEENAARADATFVGALIPAPRKSGKALAHPEPPSS